ncbi:hypothetical protein BaRGS_00015086 [Batillaria attramentaria]|uniref:Uncharacterized protein n=1 Tax=Batillaria attramentaria TaxID=370345 RepID=A0ABD0L262_9CAEN
MAHQLDYVNPFTSGTGVIGTSAVPLASPQGDRGHAPPDPTLQTLGQGRRRARLRRESHYNYGACPGKKFACIIIRASVFDCGDDYHCCISENEKMFCKVGG